MDKNRIFIAAASVTLGPLLWTGSASAEGVAAGTLIENTATATYNAGGPSETVDSNTVTILVDELLDVAVATLAAGSVSVAEGSEVLSYSITNTGNGSEAFNLTAIAAVSGNDFDVSVTSIAVDSNGNGTYDSGVDAVLGASEATPVIAADDSLTVFVLVTVPGTVTDGDGSQIELTAEAATGTGDPGDSFAGVGNGGGDAVVGSSGADDTAMVSLAASGSGGPGSATVSLTKSVTIVDPFGGSEPVPGAVATYSLLANVSGTGSVTGLRLTDDIPTGTTYEAGTLTLEAAPLTDANDADAGEASASGIDVLVGTLAAGSSRTVTFAVTID